MFAILETERLFLRAPKAADIGKFMPLLRDFDVAKNLSRVPHPYTEDDACDFMVRASVGWLTGGDYIFSILRRDDGAYVGMCGLHPSRDWEVGYWIGKPFWGHGYATEACGRVVALAFAEKGAERLLAKWFHDNPASGRVLEKLEFRPIGETVSDCLARGAQIASHAVALDRATYITRKNVS